MKHLLKNTRGASAVEYAMLLALIGGLALIAVLSLSTDARRALERPAIAMASTVPGLASSAADPDSPAPTEPETPAPPSPVFLYEETAYTLRGMWVPSEQTMPTNGYYNAYTPETLTLRTRFNTDPLDLTASRLGGETLDRFGPTQSLEYQPTAGQWSHSSDRMNAFVLFTTAPGARAFVVPMPRGSQQAAVDSGRVWRVYSSQTFIRPPSSSLLPNDIRALGVTTAYYECGEQIVAHPAARGALSVCPDE